MNTVPLTKGRSLSPFRMFSQRGLCCLDTPVCEFSCRSAAKHTPDARQSAFAFTQHYPLRKGFSPKNRGSRVFAFGGWGVNRAPQNWGVWEKGSIDRTINQLIVNSGTKGAESF